MTQLECFKRLLREAPKIQSLVILCLVFLGSLTDGIGLMMLIPIIKILSPQAEMVGSQLLVPKLTKVMMGIGIPLSAYTILPLFVLAILLRSMVHYYRTTLASRLQLVVVDRLRLQCFDALIRSEWRWQSSRRQSDHAGILLGNLTQVGFALQQAIFGLATIVTVGTFVGVALIMSWQMSLLTMMAGSILFYATRRRRQSGLSESEQVNHNMRSLTAQVWESLASIRLTKILSAEQQQFDRFADIVEKNRVRKIRQQEIMNQSVSMVQAGSALLLVIYVLVGIAVLKTPMATLVMTQ